jgi:hypothetical protein
MYDATNDSIASASCSGLPGLFMKYKSHAAIVSPTPGVNGYSVDPSFVEVAGLESKVHND